MATEKQLPTTHRVLSLASTSEAPTIQSVPVPQPTPGSAVVTVLVADVLHYARSAYNGSLGYPFPTPLVIGSNAIARIAAVGPDATSLNPGQLVLVDVNIRARDDPTVNFLFGLHSGATDGSRKLMEGEWRDSTYAEYAKVPLENCYALNEKLLLGPIGEGGFGYKVEELAYLLRLLVPNGGLKDMDIKPGEIVVVAPATGAFGGAAVEVAVAMGARVIAAGRNVEALKESHGKRERVETVQLTGDVMADAGALQKLGVVDAYLDFSPAAAAKSTHIKSCLLALKTFGKAAFMGGIQEDVSIPYGLLMFKSLQLRGRFMYDQEAVRTLIKMVEAGLLKLGPEAGLKIVGTFGLDDWDKAFTAAERSAGWGLQVLIAP